MASSPYSDSVDKGLTDLRMKIIKQKIANEREKLNRPNSTDSTEDVDEQLRLQQAMLKRQELLDRIRHEQLVNQQADQRRPRSYTERRRYTPSPAFNPPPSRLSLPDLNRNKGDITYRDPYQNQKMYGTNREMSGVKHVIEHSYKPTYPYHLPQMDSYPMPVPVPQQQIIQRIPVPVVPQPVYQNLVPPAPEQPKGSMFNKNDQMEMMMIQQQQVHQMMMQQIMMKQMGGGSSHQCAQQYPSYCCTEPMAPVVVPRASGQVHHHHYGMSPAPAAAQQPVVHHYSQLPAIDGGRMMSPARGEVTERRIIQAPTRQQRTRSVSPPPVARKRSNQGNRPSSVFLFGIILKEIVAALHRIYLNPSGNIYPVLADIISPKAYDLTNLLRGRTNDRETQVMIQELCYVVENLCYHITEIMPSTGVLGTHRKSAAFELIRDGKRFPDGYYWQVELDRLNFTENGRTVNVGDEEAFMLIVGIFISRSLITTLLMKPVDYGLSSAQLTDVAERNLKILATAMLFLVRRISIARGRAMMPMPSEIAKYLYTDEEMRPIFTRMGKSFNYSEGLLREWGQEYIKRLRAAPVPK